MVICGLGRHLMDVYIKNNFKDFSFKDPIYMLLFPFIDSIFFYSIEKFMKYKYYSPFFILFLLGCIDSIISIILIISFYRHTDLLNDRDKMYIYIPLFIIISILFAYEFLAKLITINSFTIFHYILLVYFGELISYIFDLISNFNIAYMIIIIITFFFEIFECLVFIETIELNFCGLNLNIKKSIMKRAIIELNSIYAIREEENEEDDEPNEILNNVSDENASRTNSVY